MVTEKKIEGEPDLTPAPPAARWKTTMIVLNSIIGLLVITVAYLIYTFFLLPAPQKEKENAQNQPVRIIQLDVLNGCGVPGLAARMTDLLRQRGFDVVEVKNYVSFQVPHTIIIDRIGNRVAARRVAAALGVDEQNIVQQINADYFVDVSVVVGKDYSTLKPSQSTIVKEND